MAVFELENVSFCYRGREHKALSGLNVTVQEGEFLIVAGASGSGKSTLLKLLKQTIAPAGELDGRILYHGRPLQDLDEKTLASEIGFVFQNPESQLVTEHVFNELAFGLENIGASPVTIDCRVAETASFFGMEAYFDRRTTQLSGGEKQLLNLASVMVMEPAVLLLDEPLSQLDPIARLDFLEQLRRVNQELGITIIMAEHNLDDVYALCDRILVLDEGKSFFIGEREQAAKTLFEQNHPMALAMPASVRLMKQMGLTGVYPADTKEARSVLQKRDIVLRERKEQGFYPHGQVILKCKNITFAYRRGASILEEFDLSLQEGSCTGIIGGNGAGKSTLLGILSGNLRPQGGKVICKKTVGYLPQNPYYMFIKDTLAEDLAFLCKSRGKSSSAYIDIMEAFPLFHSLKNVMGQNPLDLSGGEAQKAALLKLLIAGNEILLLDEPAKGLDAAAKIELTELLFALRQKGITIVFVSHDLDFTAKCATNCVFLFHGRCAAAGTPHELFCANSYYTTPVRKITRGFAEGAVTELDLEAAE